MTQDQFIDDLEMFNTFKEPEKVLSGDITELTNEQKAVLAEIKDQRESEYLSAFDEVSKRLFDSLNF